MRTSSIKIIGYTLFVIVAIILAIFLYFFIYYTWQFKYGSAETVQKITQTLEGNFTQVDKNADTPQYTSNWKSFIRPQNPKLGNSSAPVTIIMFIDFECPFCQSSFPIMNQIMDTFGDAIQVVFKQFPIAGIHPNANNAAIAASCAEEQKVFWKFYNQTFTGGTLDESSLYAYAADSGVDLQIFDTCVKNKKYGSVIEQDLSDGLELGVRGTPTYLVNGKFVEGVHTVEEWKAIILEELNQY